MSNLLLKIKCFDANIYMKTEYLQTTKTQHYFERKMLEKQERESKSKSLALIKSLIYAG